MKRQFPPSRGATSAGWVGFQDAANHRHGGAATQSRVKSQALIFRGTERCELSMRRKGFILRDLVYFGGFRKKYERFFSPAISEASQSSESSLSIPNAEIP